MATARDPIQLSRLDIEIFVTWLEEIKAANDILNDVRFSQIYHGNNKSDSHKRDVLRHGLQHVVGDRSARIAADLQKALRSVEKKPQLQPVDGGRA